MRDSPVHTLRHHFERLKIDALRIALSHFECSQTELQHNDLVDGNCGEVISQGVDELLNSLLEDVPDDKHRLLSLVRKTQTDLSVRMKLDLLGCLQRMGVEERAIIIKALDISDPKPQAICEQILINGLDAYLSQLSNHNKLEPIAKAFGVQATAEDAVEQIIDQVFPPPEVTPEAPTSKKELAKVATPKPKAIPKPAPPPPPLVERLSLADHNEFLRNTRPPLQKGIALEDIQNMYWMDELKQFCKDNGLKCQAKKSALNRVVFQFVNSGQVPAAKPSGKRRGRGAPRPKKKTRSAATGASEASLEGSMEQEAEDGAAEVMGFVGGDGESEVAEGNLDFVMPECAEEEPRETAETFSDETDKLA